MTRTVSAGPLSGTVHIPASKSQAHRLMICAALGTAPVTLYCDGLSRDIEATIDCLRALGACIEVSANSTLHITPIIAAAQQSCRLPCGESGSTLRFLLPVAAALGADSTFHMEGRLPQRPLAPLDEQLRRHGAVLTKDGATLSCRGQLQSGEYTLPGDISSQYISGLLFALPLLQGDSLLHITGKVESASYIAMTEDALRLGGISFEKHGQTYRIPGSQRYALPDRLQVEGDWSNAAFFLCAGALSPASVTVTGLNADSSQGDRAVVDLLRRFGAKVLETDNVVTVSAGSLRGLTIDAAAIPDLIPVISVVAAAAEGETRITGAGRLRLKESDRLQTTAQLLTALGGDVTELPDGLVIRGKHALSGGTADACGDHRIAMSAAVAGCICQNSVTVLGSECVSKSYPRFWEDYSKLKG